MTVRHFSIEDSHLIIEHAKKDENDRYITWAIFDTSRTVEWRWVAVTSERYDILLTFSNIDELLLWCAHHIKVDGDTVRIGEDCREPGGLEWLEKTAQDTGYENWEQFCAEWLEHIGAKSADQPPA